MGAPILNWVVYRDLRSLVSAIYRGFDIFHGSFEHDFSELIKQGSGFNRVAVAAT